jgi:hypothetical protein
MEVRRRGVAVARGVGGGGPSDATIPGGRVNYRAENGRKVNNKKKKKIFFRSTNFKPCKRNVKRVP